MAGSPKISIFNLLLSANFLHPFCTLNPIDVIISQEFIFFISSKDAIAAVGPILSVQKVLLIKVFCARSEEHRAD